MAYIPDAAILDAKDISNTAFRLFAYYCKHGSKDKPHCHPKLKTAARDLALNYTYTTKVHKELIDEGWIRVEAGIIFLLKGWEKSCQKSNSDPSEELPKKQLSEDESADESCQNDNSELPKKQSEVAKMTTESCQKSNSPYIEPASSTTPSNQPIEPAKGNVVSIADFKSEPEPSEREVVETVFAYYQTEIDADSRLTTKRRILLEVRYREGWSLEQMKKAVDGCRDDPWEERCNFNAIENIFGKPENIERFIKIAKNGNNDGKSKQRTEQNGMGPRASRVLNRNYAKWGNG